MVESAPAAVTVNIQLVEGYRFRADFGDDRGALVMDEPKPLGDGLGPNASAVLGAAVADCLCASLLFCLRKAHVELRGLRAEAQVSSSRNERGRLRVSEVRVQLHPELGPGDEGRVARCLELFEDFCVVTEAVRGGIDVDVEVELTPRSP